MSEGSLRTTRLLLRRPQADDLDEIAALHGHPDVMRFIDNGRPVPREVVRTRDLAWLTADYGPGRGYWIALERDTGLFVGWFGLRPLPDRPEVLELGYRLRPEMWGRGLATEGARLLVRHALQTVGASEVFATTMTVNHGSRRVLAKAGLSLQRTVYLEWPEPIPGSEYGDVEYAATPEGGGHPAG
ncbi:MAG TPA: GNAT family N-acetyltransferase [Jatrophihabitans sp.]|nr:GNAT family N-acetyltransferase [Jatrophihabitans sp.]